MRVINSDVQGRQVEFALKIDDNNYMMFQVLEHDCNNAIDFHRALIELMDKNQTWFSQHLWQMASELLEQDVDPLEHLR